MTCCRSFKCSPKAWITERDRFKFRIGLKIILQIYYLLKRKHDYIKL